MQINISELFSDILPDPRKELQNKALTRAALASQGMQGPLAALSATTGYNSALSGEGMRAGLNRMTGGAMSTAAERLQKASEGIDTSTPQGQAQLLSIVRRERGAGAAEQLREVFRQRNIQDQEMQMKGVEQQQRNEQLRQNALRIPIEQQMADATMLNAQVNVSQIALDYAESLRRGAGGNLNVSMTKPIGMGYAFVGTTSGEQILMGPEGRVPANEIGRVLEMVAEHDIEVEVAKKRALELEDQRAVLLTNALENMQVLQAGHNTYLEIVRSIDQGAQSGPIRNKFPTLNDHTRELRRLANQLGLDVIAQGKFGALSEQELKVAMETAINRDLPEHKLREQIVERARLQTILIRQLEDLAIGLANGKDFDQVISEIGDNADEYRKAIFDYGPDEQSEEDRLIGARTAALPEIYGQQVARDNNRRRRR